MDRDAKKKREEREREEKEIEEREREEARDPEQEKWYHATIHKNTEIILPGRSRIG